MYYTSAHSSLKSDLKFRTLLLPSVGSIFLNQKMENYILEKFLETHAMAPFRATSIIGSAASKAKRAGDG